MRGPFQSQFLPGRAVSFLGTALVTAAMVGAPLAVFAQTGVEATRTFSPEADAVVDSAFDLAALDDIAGAISILDELAQDPDLSAYEKSEVSHMIGAFHYDAGHLYEAKLAFDAAVDAGGLTADQIAKMKPTLANINALDKLGLLKPKATKQAVAAAPKETEIATDAAPELEAEVMAEADIAVGSDVAARSDIASAEDSGGPAEEVAVADLSELAAAGDALDSEAAEIKLPGEMSTLSDEIKVEASLSDRDLNPLVRIPPMMPPSFLEGDNSGYCNVRFDVGADGQPYNVVTTRCTSSVLENPTTKSIYKWKYAPKMVNGRAVVRNGVEETIRYNLQDERGNLLPMPSGF